MMPLKSALSEKYYSSNNMNYIQEKIASQVRDKTGYSIGRQNDMDLYNLMRRVYTDYIRDDSANVSDQQNTMNKAVIDSATKTIVNGILQNLVYLRDISTMPVPPDTPKNTSTHGLKLSRY
jgi:Family of unknown function (DUF5761)